MVVMPAFCVHYLWLILFRLCPPPCYFTQCTTTVYDCHIESPAASSHSSSFSTCQNHLAQMLSPAFLKPYFHLSLFIFSWSFFYLTRYACLIFSIRSSSSSKPLKEWCLYSLSCDPILSNNLQYHLHTATSQTEFSSPNLPLEQKTHIVKHLLDISTHMMAGRVIPYPSFPKIALIYDSCPCLNINFTFFV